MVLGSQLKECGTDVCAYHNAMARIVTIITTTAKVLMVVAAGVGLILSALITLAYNGLSDTDKKLEVAQEKHVEDVGKKMERTIETVRNMETKLDKRMENIEHEQLLIKQNQEDITGYLQLLIEDRGLYLKPKVKRYGAD